MEAILEIWADLTSREMKKEFNSLDKYLKCNDLEFSSILNVYIILHGCFPVNMLNVTRVTLSHNRIACKCQMEANRPTERFLLMAKCYIAFNLCSNSAGHCQFNEFGNTELGQQSRRRAAGVDFIDAQTTHPESFDQPSEHATARIRRLPSP